MGKRIPVFILTGFLGSGKTTVLKKMVQAVKAHGEHPSIVMNELGAENVEKELFQDEAMIEFLNGCICCTIQDDMRVELQRFLQVNRTIDVLLIEGTGIANPAEIIEALTHPDLIDQVEIQSVIGMVDASRYLEYQSLFQSSKEIRTMLKQQVSSSTLLLVNKTDLLPEKKLQKVTEKLEATKMENTPIVYSVYGNVSEEELFEKRMFDKTVDLTKKSDHSHHHHHAHSHPFQAIKFDGVASLQKKQLETWLKEQEGLLRAKGYVRFEGNAELFSFQFSSNQLDVTPLEDSIKPTCIILIGTTLNENVLRDSFELLVKQNV